MLQMVILDESNKGLDALVKLFEGQFLITPYEPVDLGLPVQEGTCPPHIVLLLSKGNVETTRATVESIRKLWPKAVLILLLPTIHNEAQLGCDPIPAHKLLFKPCTKRRVLETVNNYVSLLESGPSGDENALLATLVEFVGERQGNLYIAYNRIMPMIMSICTRLDYDWRHIQKIFILYMILLSYSDPELVSSIMFGEGRKAKLLKELYTQIEKMADLLELNPATEELAPEIRYLLKRYDGEGEPHDEVAGLELPVSSRMIRLLLDYHYLLQSGKTTGQTLFILHQREGWYDDVLLQTFISMHAEDGRRCIREIYPLGLVAGMEIAEDVYGFIDGTRRKILSAREVLTDSAVDYLQRHCEDVLDITEPVKVVEELFTKNGDFNV